MFVVEDFYFKLAIFHVMLLFSWGSLVIAPEKRVYHMKLNLDNHTRFLNMYTPQQIEGFERALEKCEVSKHRYTKKLEELQVQIDGFKKLLREVKKDAK